MSSKLTLESTIALPSGNKSSIPALGFGVYQSPANVCKNSCLTALKNGYRHIDSAQYYANEKEVGEALAESGLDRKDVFVTTKILGGGSSIEASYDSIVDSVDKIGGGYVNLFLIHSPHAGPEKRKVMWQALEKAQSEGKVKHIGVSNFGVKHLEDLKSYAEVWPPAVNQIELHPWCQQAETVKYCQENGIPIQAYCPIVRNQKANDPMLKTMSEKYGVTPNQVLIRWSLQKGYIPLPKSDTPDRIKQNADLYGFEIDGEDMKKLDELDEGERGAIVEFVNNNSLN